MSLPSLPRKPLQLLALIALLLALAALPYSQNSDEIPTAAGEAIRVVPLGHGTVGFVYGRNVILVDPARFVPGQPDAPKDDLQAMAKAYLAKFGAPPPPPKQDEEPVAELLVSAAPVRTEQIARFKNVSPPKLILVTHTHTDHLDPRAISSLRTADTRVIVPTSATAMLLDVGGAEPMANSDRKVLGGLTVEAVPMYNPQPDAKLGYVFHPKGRGNGYVLTLGGLRLYVAGDTGCTPEMMALRNIDVAFVPMNLPYTMTPAEAAECVMAMRPRIVYPYHYFESDPKVFATILRGSGIDVRLRDWYAAGATAQR